MNFAFNAILENCAIFPVRMIDLHNIDFIRKFLWYMVMHCIISMLIDCNTTDNCN